MKPQQLLDTVCRAADILMEAARPHEGLFPSLLDIESRQMPVEMPPAIAGQRDGDRAHPGSNLIHDETTLLLKIGHGKLKIENWARTKRHRRIVRG